LESSFKESGLTKDFLINPIKMVRNIHKEINAVSVVESGQHKFTTILCFREALIFLATYLSRAAYLSRVAYLSRAAYLPCILLFIQLLLYPLNASGAKAEISEVFIEGVGNNKYEAKIKAHEQGMKRVFFLVADKFNIKNKDTLEAPFSRLREVFKPIKITNELSTIDKYNATVTYEYDRAKLYKLLVDYGNNTVNDMFYECLVIPVFKQGEVLTIWDQEKKWNDIWIEARPELEKHKILYPVKTLLISKKITPDNIFALTYEDLIEIFPKFLFKKAIIITSEYFTNKNNGESFMRVNSYILDNDSLQNSKLEHEYKLFSLNDVRVNVNAAISKFMNNYGAIRKVKSLTIANDDSKEEELAPIIMSFDAFDQEELDTVNNKLKKVKQIKKFIIKNDYETRYKILIYTDASEYELAEGLYINGLSYKIHGNLYDLIDIKKSGG